ncbi:MAG: hypothetical protein CTY25_07710 [Methylobacterium sp.]|nr:MAG: hypothetical protein CTY25_07710 [Methylobacterium sp.]
MEEILASIRRIIADDSLGTKKDNTPAAAPPPPPPAAAAPAVVEPEEDLDADVLDLAEVGTLAAPEPDDDMMIGEAEDVTAEAEEFPGLPEPEAVMVLPEDMPEPVPVMVTPPPLATPVAIQEHIISSQTSGLVANAFATLSRNTPMPAPGRSLEDVVAEMLRPMLREWMDSHLPGIVERLVRAEIERVARGG